MKQIFVDGKGGVHVLDVPAPSLFPGSVLIRTVASLISQGTEGAAVSRRSGLLGLYEKATQSTQRLEQVWNMARQNGILATQQAVLSKVQDLTPLGYSSVGLVAETSGSDTGFAPNDLVATMGVGFATHSELATIPAALAVKVPSGVAAREAAFGAVACIAMQGIRRLELSAGETIVVVGLGLIGQLAVQIGAALGYRMFGIDLSSEKAQLAGECGAVDAWATSDADSVARVAEWTDGNGADGVVIAAAAKSSEILNEAFDLCRQKGRVSVVGDVGLEADRSKMFRKELELRMSTSYGPGRYDPEYELEGKDYPIGHARWTERRNLSLYLDLIRRGKLNVDRLVSREFAITEAASAYELIKSGGNSFGVLFTYPLVVTRERSNGVAARDKGAIQYRSPSLRPSKKNGAIRLGLIGCGAFTKAVHLPNLNALSNDFKIEGVASRTGATAGAVARRTNARIAASDYRELIADSNIDALLIATRHASHGRIAAEALAAGKHVFVEKPLAITVEECQKIESLARENDLVVRVGFNRRFAPLYQRARDLLSARAPRMILYRVNVGDVSQHWSAGADEGGRLLGEGCHFLDLFNWLFSSAPLSTSVNVAGNKSTTNPNVVFTASYPGGAVATLLYSTIGSREMPKERLEAFASGLSLSCTDFNRLEVFGGRSTARGSKDKGHRGVLTDFAQAIRGEAPPHAGADARAGLLATAMALSAYGAADVNEIVSQDS